MKQIVIEWPQLERKVRVELDLQRNRAVTELFIQHLPYRVLQNHALVSGDHLYHTCPIVELVHAKADYVVPDRTVCVDGTVFLSHLVHLGIKYGDLTEYLPAAPVGQVVAEDLPILKEVGEALWQAAYISKEFIEAHVYVPGQADTKGKYLGAAPQVSDVDVQALVDEMWDEANRISLTPPEELVDIHQGDIDSRAGSRAQYFTTMIFVNGEQRPFGYNAIGGLLSAARCQTTTLDMLREITPHFLRTPAAFLEYCGLRRQFEFVSRVQQCLPLLTDKAEFHAVIAALYMYSNLLNSWNLHLFPWNSDAERFSYDSRFSTSAVMGIDLKDATQPWISTQGLRALSNAGVEP
jgi:hypothetical protein